MPKAEKGSLKDLGKQMKAKGLQKLRFYCQMCEKQCRDANGFKCHLTSDSHLRNMKIFSENSGRILNTNSREFETIFLDTLRMRHSTAKVNANQVYQQVISDKSHIHMNSTIWSTLSGFVQYLGKTGKCIVEETERGWYITYINRDVGKMQREEAQRARQQAELEAEASVQKRMDVQRVEAAKALDRATGGVVHEAPSSILKDGGGAGDSKVELNLTVNNIANPKKRKIIVPSKSIFGEESGSEEEEQESGAVEVTSSLQKPQHQPPPRTKTTEQQRSLTTKTTKVAKQDISSDDVSWLFQNIMVRIVNKKLCNGKYYRKKAKIETLKDDDFTAIVTLVDDGTGGDVLQLDQDDLETVVPKSTGEMVRMVRGELRGETAVVTRLDKEKCRAELKLTTNGTLLRKVIYDNFSKLAE